MADTNFANYSLSVVSGKLAVVDSNKSVVYYILQDEIPVCDSFRINSSALEILNGTTVVYKFVTFLAQPTIVPKITIADSTPYKSQYPSEFQNVPCCVKFGPTAVPLHIYPPRRLTNLQSKSVDEAYFANKDVLVDSLTNTKATIKCDNNGANVYFANGTVRSITNLAYPIFRCVNNGTLSIIREGKPYETINGVNSFVNISKATDFNARYSIEVDEYGLWVKRTSSGGITESCLEFSNPTCKQSTSIIDKTTKLCSGNNLSYEIVYGGNIALKTGKYISRFTIYTTADNGRPSSTSDYNRKLTIGSDGQIMFGTGGVGTFTYDNGQEFVMNSLGYLYAGDVKVWPTIVDRTPKKVTSTGDLGSNTLANYEFITNGTGDRISLAPGKILRKSATASTGTSFKDFTFTSIPICKLTPKGSVLVFEPGKGTTPQFAFWNNDLLTASDSNYTLTVGATGFAVTNSNGGIFQLDQSGASPTAVPTPTPVPPVTSASYVAPLNTVVSSDMGSTTLLPSTNSLTFNVVNADGTTKTESIASVPTGATGSLTFTPSGSINYTYTTSTGTVTAWSVSGWVPNTNSYTYTVADGKIVINNIQVYPPVTKTVLQSGSTGTNMLANYDTLEQNGMVLSILDNGVRLFNKNTNTVVYNVAMSFRPTLIINNDGRLAIYNSSDPTKPPIMTNHTLDFAGASGTVYNMVLDQHDAWIRKNNLPDCERIFKPYTVDVKTSLPNNSSLTNVILQSSPTPREFPTVNAPTTKPTIECGFGGSLRCKDSNYNSLWTIGSGYDSTLRIDSSTGEILYGNASLNTYAISEQSYTFTIDANGHLYFGPIRVYV